MSFQCAHRDNLPFRRATLRLDITTDIIVVHSLRHIVALIEVGLLALSTAEAT